MNNEIKRLIKENKINANLLVSYANPKTKNKPTYEQINVKNYLK
jgi:hypothetical protein